MPGPASLVDVPPTALSLLGLRVPEGLDGVDLSAHWQGDDLAGRTLFAEATSPTIKPLSRVGDTPKPSSQRNDALRSIRRGGKQNCAP